MQDQLSSGDLIRLVEVVGTLSQRHRCSFGEAVDRLGRLAAAPEATRVPRPVAGFAERMRAIRRERNAAMGAPVFRDPGWDMMLDLFIGQARGRACSTSALCSGSGAPTTTALRHLDRLEKARLIVRRDDRSDHRRTLIELAPGVAERLVALLVRMQESW